MIEDLIKSLSDEEYQAEGYIREDEFKVFAPIEYFEKSKKDDPYKGCHIKGLASTEDQDLQDEILKAKGMDIASLKEGRGVFNYDHKDGPENVIGKIEDAEITGEGLKVEGYLFQEHDRGKAFLQILKSLKPKDKHRVQMSVEGKILERDTMNSKIINKASITKVALTLDPVNPKTWTELTKSFSKAESEDSPAQDKKEETLGEIEMSPNLLTRLLEWAKSEAKSDDEIHDAIKNALELYAKHDMLTIDNYEGVVGEKETMEKKKEVKKSNNSEEIASYMSKTLKTLLKTLSVGNAYQTSPGNMTGGGAMSKESIDGECKDTKKKSKKKKKKK